MVVSPANAAYTATELAHQVNDSGSTIVMCAPSVLPVVLEATSKWENQKKRIVLSCRRHETDNKDYRNLDDLFGEELLKPHVYKDPTEELAYMCYSSGTTGVAKGVMTTGKRGLRQLIWQQADFYRSVQYDECLERSKCVYGREGRYFFRVPPTIAHLRHDEIDASACARRADCRHCAKMGA